jgi:hypothetical protein
MSQSTKDKRADHFKNNKDKEGEDAFKPAPGDSKADTKPSQHTKKYKKMFGEGAADKSLQKKADKSGMPVGILKQVYKRGVAAWKGGHRPGTTPEQWGHARVNSFVTKSKGTWGGADQDLAKKVQGKSESIEEAVDIKKQLKKIKGLTKDQIRVLSTIPTPMLTTVVNQLSTLMMSEVKEGKLVTDWRSILEYIFKNIMKMVEKEYEKNPEKGIGMINQLGSYVRMKVTDKKQEKGKLFLKFGEEVELEESAAEDAAILKAKQVEEMERMKQRHVEELEALTDRHERETEKVNKQKEKEVINKQIQAKRDAARKAAEKQNESVDEQGLWDNIRAKKARGEKMRKKGEEGAPTDDQVKRAQEDRDYKKEYESYHSKPEQIKRRAKRNEARRSLKDRKDIKGKDVHHKDNNPMNNDKSNLSIVSQKYNRSEPRMRKLKEKGFLQNGKKRK